MTFHNNASLRQFHISKRIHIKTHINNTEQKAHTTQKICIKTMRNQGEGISTRELLQIKRKAFNCKYIMNFFFVFKRNYT